MKIINIKNFNVNNKRIINENVSVYKDNKGFIMCDSIREVPTILPPRISGFAKPPTLYGTLNTFIIWQMKQRVQLHKV